MLKYPACSCVNRSQRWMMVLVKTTVVQLRDDAPTCRSTFSLEIYRTVTADTSATFVRQNKPYLFPDVQQRVIVLVIKLKIIV